MPEVSRTSAVMPRSAIREMAALATGMDNVVSLVFGEPDFYTPQNIIDAGIKALERKETHYTPNAGIMCLREAIAETYKPRNMCYSAEEILVTSGAVNALLLAMMAVVEHGDEVIISDPSWSNYLGMVMQVGGKPVPVQVYEQNGFMYDINDLRKAITSKTKAIVLNSPSNPTGGVASKENLEAIAKLAVEKDLFIITDEIYRQLIYTGEEYTSIASFEGMKERTIIIDGFSKAYAMTGWRIGYAASDKNIIAIMTKLLENVVSCVNSVAQYAALEAIKGSQEPVAQMREQYKKRRDIIVAGLNSIKGISCIMPKGAFYAFPNISKTGLTSKEFATRLLNEKHVVTVPGIGFGEGGEGFIRLSYATSEENIRESLKRIREFVESI